MSQIDKVWASADEAVADIASGASLAVGGFGLSGVPIVLIDALNRTDADDLKVASNNCGVDGWGLGVLLEQHRISRVTASYIGENKEFARQYLGGEIEVELTPQGTLAERLRAAGTGIPAFYTPAGVGTMIADGGLPWRYDAEGNVVATSPAKEVREFEVTQPDGSTLRKPHVLEIALDIDVSLVRACEGRPARQPGVQQVRAATSTHSARWRAGSRSPRSRSSSSPARSTPTRSTCPASSSTAWSS